MAEPVGIKAFIKRQAELFGKDYDEDGYGDICDEDDDNSRVWS